MLVFSKNPSLTLTKQNFRHFVQQGDPYDEVY